MADELDAGQPTGFESAPSLLKTSPRTTANLEVMAGQRVQSSVDPNVSYPDMDYDAQARAITEHFQAEESLRASTFRSEHSPAPRDPNVQEGAELARNMTNFLFHDEMAAIGVDWGRDHINWSLDNARDFWHEHPWRTGLAIVNTGAPILAAAHRLAILGKGADAAIGAEALMGHGLIDTVEEFSKLSPHAQGIVQGQAKKIAEIASLKGKIKDGTATPIEQGKSIFNTAFGNSYLDVQAEEAMRPFSTLKAWSDRVDEITTGRAVTGMLEMAGNVKAHEGTQILHALKDPSQMKGLSQEAKLFTMTYGSEARDLQKKLLDEGFITQETYDKVGDVWFSTLRRDGKILEEGPTSQYSIVKRKGQGDPLRVVNVPRTASPHLLERSLDQQGVVGLLKRQRAAEALTAGKTDKAINLLKDSAEDADALSMIKQGRHGEAADLLGKDGFITSNPNDLVVKSLLQQKLLFENFKTLRDVAMDTNLTKTFEEVQAMSKSAQARMIPLSRMENSATLSRMIAKKLGKAEGAPLGYVHDSLFNALAQATDKSTIGHGVSLLEIGTAMLKTMKTSANPFTHLQNVLGNAIFLHMAGFNTFSGENMGLLKKSWTAVDEWKKARKGGAALAEIKDLGFLDSAVEGGKAIDIAKELQNPLLSGAHGILDMSSIEASEGIPMLGRLAREASDEQVLAKGLIGAIQKGSAKVGLDKASDMYMAEDSAMKFTYFLHLRQQGLNPLAAANEVARRLPMYGSVGTTIQRARKVWLPWASFPTEATRIIKNNMVDYPFRTAMWMHAPNLVQAPTAALSGMSYEEVEKRKQQNPMWAQKLTSLVTPLRDKNDDVRTAIMDFLPQSAIYPQTIATDAGWREKLPYGLGNPAPIITGFVDALMGRGSFGQDISTDPNHPSQKLFTILSSTVGLMMPPIVQKYLFNPEQAGLGKDFTPGGYGLPGYKAMQDVGEFKNPSTGKTGDPLYDAVLNNFLIKNYAGSGETEVGNQRYGQREIANYRGRLGREFAAWTTSGNWQQASNTLRDVYMTFLSETPENPALARQNYADWMKLHARDVLKHPQLKGLSKEDFVKLITKVGDSNAPVVSQAHKDYVDALRQGYSQAGRAGGYKHSNPLTRGPRDVSTGISTGLSPGM